MTSERKLLFSFREGDSPGGYWAQILEGESVVATVYKPGLAEEIIAYLNWDGSLELRV